MKVTLISVLSADGFVARARKPDDHTWTSSEDWQAFVRIRDAHDTVLMDAATYEQVQPEPDVSLLRLVYTASGKYVAKAVPGRLECTSSEPLALITQLEARGRHSLLLAGGAELSASFVRAGLVSDLYVTYEPVLFGAGLGLLAGALNQRLRLVSARQLNERGTLLAHYRAAPLRDD